ncbi:MAG: hypothetical protein ORN57_05185, partial [Alphaproteobacteria bacterium]|nr:hypothetical protein [Alphaproteobacteria bacterium]
MSDDNKFPPDKDDKKKAPGVAGGVVSIDGVAGGTTHKGAASKGKKKNADHGVSPDPNIVDKNPSKGEGKAMTEDKSKVSGKDKDGNKDDNGQDHDQPQDQGDRKNKSNLVCSFCSKKQQEVLKLIAGPGVYICNECVALCNDIVAEQKPQLRSVGGMQGEEILLTPRKITEFLNQYIIGQEPAKKILSV